MREDQIFEHGLPSSDENERMVIAGVMVRGLELLESSNLRPSDFMLEKHRLIWTAFENLQERSEPIDRVTTAHEIVRMGQVENVTLSYLSEIADGMPLLASVEAYAKIVREKANLRRGATIMQGAMNRFLQAEEPAAEIIGSTISALEEIETHGSDAEWQTAGEIIQDFPGGWDALVSPAAKDQQTGIALPWKRVQQTLCGIQKGELMILAGRPSMGKSALAMQIALHAAEQNYGVAYVSLEMTGPALVRRQASQLAHIDSVRMKLGYLNAGDRHILSETQRTVSSLPLYMEHKQHRGRTAAAILASIRYLKARCKVGLVIVDHFHLVDGPEREERIKYNRIADAFQRGAREMEIPFIVLAQLNRKCEEERREPGLSDLKECGKLEENADSVLFIHRPEMYAHLRDREDLKGMADLIVAKQRDGATGKAPLVFIGAQTRFVERSAEDVQ